MHHAGSHHLEPLLSDADIHLDAGLDERKIARPVAKLDLRADEEFAEELLDDELVLRERDIVSDDEPLDLVKVRLVRGVGRLVAEDTSRDDDPERRGLCLQVAHLHWTRVGAEEEAITRLRARSMSVLNPESVPHIACRVRGGNIQGIEVVLLRLELGALDDGEVHPREDAPNLILDEGEGVEVADGESVAGERHIARFRGGDTLDLLRAERDRLRELALQELEPRTLLAPVLLGHILDRLQESGEHAALPPKVRDLDLRERGGIVSAGNALECTSLQFIDIHGKCGSSIGEEGKLRQGNGKVALRLTEGAW